MSLKTKKCRCCRQDLPATPEYYHHAPHGIDGLNSQCKGCVLAKRKEAAGKPKKKRKPPVTISPMPSILWGLAPVQHEPEIVIDHGLLILDSKLWRFVQCRH